MISADEMLNGGGAISPAVSSVTTRVAQPAAQAASAGASRVKGTNTASQTVLLVWFGLLAVLVLAHVLTLSVQR